MYWVKTPWWLPRLFGRSLLWKMTEQNRPAVYLTFDDGPHPTATPFVLDQLSRYRAKATFFCIGKNVTAYPQIFSRIAAEGHATGNHTQNHLNGWKTSAEDYIEDILVAHKHIRSPLFRPPYGRIKKAQAYLLTHGRHPWKVCMWDVLSGDFDTAISPEQCLQNVLKHIEPGSIVVFHDSTKAWDRMSYALPYVLDYCRKMDWACLAL